MSVGKADEGQGGQPSGSQDKVVAGRVCNRELRPSSARRPLPSVDNGTTPTATRRATTDRSEFVGNGTCSCVSKTISCCY